MPSDAGPGSLAELIGGRSSGLSINTRERCSLESWNRTILVCYEEILNMQMMCLVQRLFQVSTAKSSSRIQIVNLLSYPLFYLGI